MTGALFVSKFRRGAFRENFAVFVLAVCVVVACVLLWASHVRSAEKADRLIREIELLRETVERKL